MVIYPQMGINSTTLELLLLMLTLTLFLTLVLALTLAVYLGAGELTDKYLTINCQRCLKYKKLRNICDQLFNYFVKIIPFYMLKQLGFYIMQLLTHGVYHTSGEVT